MAKRYWHEEVLPASAMVAGEFSYVAVNILFKVASAKGMSYYIFLTYCFALGTLVLLPVTLFLISKKGPPPFKLSLISRLCLLALVGFSSQIGVYKGLDLGNPTLASAMSNLIPAFTFILAVCFRVFCFPFFLPTFYNQVGQMREMARRYGYMEILPSTAMVAVEFSNVVLHILFKAASSKGLSYNIFIAYCYVLGSLVFLPLVFLFNRNTVLPPLKFPLISRIFLLGITGYSGLVCSYKGIELGSPTLASAISNLTPAFTFILAVFFRMENVAFRSSSTQAKIIGTITSISGASVIVFYKGPKVISSHWTSSSVLHQRPLGSSQSNWIIGGLLEALAFLLFSFWYIIQSQIMKIYPEEIAVNFFYNLSVALVSLPVCLLAEPDLSSWRLTNSIAVIAVLYSGLFGFSFSSGLHTWGVRLKGPVFVAIFRPTSIVIAVVMSAIFLGEAVCLGSVIGAVILTAGLYAVLWGKAKEEEMTDVRVPLLQSKKVEEM